jgi:hypothetical protein
MLYKAAAMSSKTYHNPCHSDLPSAVTFGCKLSARVLNMRKSLLYALTS